MWCAVSTRAIRACGHAWQRICAAPTPAAWSTCTCDPSASRRATRTSSMPATGADFSARTTRSSPWRSAAANGPSPAPSFSGSRDSFRRKSDIEHRAAARVVGHRDRAAVALHDGLDDGQTQAGVALALLLGGAGGEEAVEEGLEGLLREAG